MADFPSTSLLDRFGYIGDLPARRWSPDTYGVTGGRFAVDGNRRMRPQAVNSDAGWTRAAPRDQEWWIELAELPIGVIELECRYAALQTASYSGYGFELLASTGQVRIYRYTAGVSATLDTTTFTAWSPGDAMGIRAVGSTPTTVSTWRRHDGVWTMLTTVTDAAPPNVGSGFGALYVASADGAFSRFGGGGVGTALSLRTGDYRPKTTVLLKSLDGWQKVGSGDARGVVPTRLSLEADASGPTQASFSLARSGDRPWLDLKPFTDMEAEVSGAKVWGGRVDQSPGEPQSLSVSAKGWQYDLDLDLFQATFVRSRITDYADQRSFPSAVLTSHLAGPQVQVGSGAITLIFPNGYTVVNNEQVCATIDVGAALIKRAVVTWERVGVSDADDTVRSRGSTAESAATAGDDSTAVLTAASGTISHTFGAARRYHHVMVYRNGAGGTFGADQGVRITGIKLFGETAYESGGESVLTADTVIKAARLFAPALSSDESLIASPGLIDSPRGIPHLTTDGYATPRSVMESVNAYHNWLLGVDAQRRVFYQDRPTQPSYEVGNWRGSTLTGLSSGTTDDVYNRVIVEGADGYGRPIQEIRTLPNPMLTRAGLTRTAKLSVGAASTSTILQIIGDVWLAEKSRTPFRGTLTVVGFGGVRRNGVAIHPAELLLGGGKLIRFLNLTDPDTGGLGRDGVIAGIKYDDDTTTATVQLDNDYSVIDTLLTRFGVLQEAMTS